MKKHLLTLLSICTIVIIIYLPLFQTPFIYDEIDFLFTWDSIHDFNHIPQLLMGDTPAHHEGVYRPIRSLAYVISYHFFHTNLFLYHIQALLIYLGSVVMVYLMTKELTNNYRITALTTLIFGILPLHVDNTANLTANFDTIGILFAFISFYFFQKLLYKNQPRTLFLSLFFSALAYFTYEITLCLPFLFLLYSHFKKEKLRISWLLSFASLPFFYLLLRQFVFHVGTREQLTHTFLEKISMMINGIGSYITASIFPLPPVDPTLDAIQKRLAESASPHTQVAAFQPETAVYLVIILLFVIGGLLLYKRRSLIGFGMVWFLISLAPTVLIVLESQPLWGRYGMIATVGISLALATICSNLLSYIPKSPLSRYFQVVGLSCMACLVIYYAVITPKALNAWHDLLPALASQLPLLPESSQKHIQLGQLYTIYFKPEEALNEYEQVRKYNPGIALANIRFVCKLAKAIEYPVKNGSNLQKTCTK